MLTREQLDTIRQRNQERRARKRFATAPPWDNIREDAEGDNTGGYSADLPDGGWLFVSRMIDRGVPGQGQPQDRADVEFCAGARNDPVELEIDALLADAEELLLLRQILSDDTGDNRWYELGKADGRREREREVAVLRREIISQTGCKPSEVDTLLGAGKPVVNARMGLRLRELVEAQAALAALQPASPPLPDEMQQVLGGES